MLPMNWNTDKAKEKWRNIFGDYRYQLLIDFNKCDKIRLIRDICSVHYLYEPLFYAQ